jgi:hypothetical protein
VTGVVVVLLFSAPPVATAQVGKVWRVGYLTNEAAEVANPSSGSQPPLVRKSPKEPDGKVRDLEKRLGEALKHEAEALDQQTATAEIPASDLALADGLPARIRHDRPQRDQSVRRLRRDLGANGR